MMLPYRRRYGATILITAGALTAVHYLGVVIAAWRAIGEVGEVQSAGWIGIAGGLLAVFAGWQVQQSFRQPTLGTPHVRPQMSPRADKFR